ncbi:MAG TPA: Tat pathway signal sequence domain protein [Brevundimonas sp.]|uniref:exo-rhamnogalacturonan lyase family protein n=1 Tax=Brevundimonas sp. TaxID=1871086 RepID=UPI002E0F7F94|nr:Tat pathway signal sequence domain protein [Brevundimonas sp.]
MIPPAFTRRSVVASVASAPMAVAAGAASARAAARDAPPATPIGWLDGAAPVRHEGQTWGVPWPEGLFRPGQAFRAIDDAGEARALQSWPLAVWPDGSLKWSGHALGAETSPAQALAVVPGTPVAPARPVRVRETDERIEIDCGPLSWRLPRRGPSLIASATHEGREVLRDLRLVCLRDDAPDLSEAPAVRQSRFESVVETAVVEQAGPVRAVVRFEGRHRDAARAWLPFTVRLYFHADGEAVRMVHSFIFDGDPATDFIRGIGVQATAPMRDALQDRHVRFGGEQGGLWGEAVRPLTGLRRDPGAPFREAQVAGQPIPPVADMDPRVGNRLHLIPAWSDFTLSQSTADGFAIRKRTGPGHAWIDAQSGGRAAGLVYAGGVSGGVALGLANFWRAGPTRLDVRGAAGEAAQVTAWLWSPDAPAMDLRPYHNGLGMTDHAAENEGLEITYEDYEAGWGTPYGIARTSELTLWALGATPPRETLAAMATGIETPPRLVCPPARLRAVEVFGDWGLPDRSTPMRARLEDRLDDLLDLYRDQIAERRWYGFWNHGDVMHSYDQDRHEWRYDIGGYAWANSELSPDLWLWYSFLRTGRADVFRMAEAMTRHSSEVDCYHIGPWRGFGTRHGVQHWSDSSKQPRVSNAAFRRIYYYLTADERIGDLMRSLVTSDETLTRVQIRRKRAAPDDPPPGGPIVDAGFGTDWSSFLAAWMTEWERTGDRRWRDRIVAGMTSLAALPHRWFHGGGHYDVRSGRFVSAGERIGISHLNAVFGAVETHAELLRLVDVPAYRACWVEYCAWYNAPAAELQAYLGTRVGNRGLPQAHSRLTAWAARALDDPALAARAAREFLEGSHFEDLSPVSRRQRVAGSAVLRPVEEEAGMSTNGVSQWSLAAIQNLELIPEALDALAEAEGQGGDAG